MCRHSWWSGSLLLAVLPAAIVLVAALAKMVQLGSDAARLRQAPHAGERIALRDMLDGIALLRKHQLQDYDLAGTLRGASELQQRTVEGAWPIRPLAASRYRLASPGEQMDSCRLLDQIASVALHDCK